MRFHLKLCINQLAAVDSRYIKTGKKSNESTRSINVIKGLKEDTDIRRDLTLQPSAQNQIVHFLEIEDITQ